MIVTVRRHWNDWRTLNVRRSDLSDLHWSSLSGGVNKPSARPFIHGYISCDVILGNSNFPHSCQHGTGPHRIKVCIVKKDNTKAVMDMLVTELGPRPGA